MQVQARYRDAFNPTLLQSESLLVSIEQQEYIRDMLSKACSDSRFVEKVVGSNNGHTDAGVRAYSRDYFA